MKQIFNKKILIVVNSFTGFYSDFHNNSTSANCSILTVSDILYILFSLKQITNVKIKMKCQNESKYIKIIWKVHKILVPAWK
jgi:hypothetical protein